MKEFFYQKMDGIYFDQLIKRSRLPSKKIYSSQCKVDFFATGQVSNVYHFSTAIPSAKNRMRSSAEITNRNG